MSNSKKRRNSSKNTEIKIIAMVIMFITGCITFLLYQAMIGNKEVNITLILIAIFGIIATVIIVYIVTNGINAVKAKASVKQGDVEVHAEIESQTSTSTSLKPKAEKPKAPKKATQESGQPEVVEPKKKRGRPRKEQ